MKIPLLTSILFFLTSIILQAFAQNPTGKEANIWYFGRKAGLDFNFSPPRALLNGKADGYGSFASICDGNGSLLFYTSPDSILDRNHQKMPNSPIGPGGATYNTAVVVPWPSNPGKYFYFSAFTGTGLGLSYSVVNMNLRNGLGDVVAGQKNIILQTQPNDKVTAVQHQNRRDIWLITHGRFSNSYHAFLVTPTGVNPIPVSSQVGMANYNDKGAFKAAPDGRTIADVVFPDPTYVLFTHIQLIDFNSSTGAMINKGVLPDTLATSLEFSPSGDYLYASGHRMIVSSIGKDQIWQYDLSQPTVGTMYANRRLVASKPMTSGPGYGFLQVGPDGKVYMSMQENFIASPSWLLSYVGAIQKPNEPAVRTNFVPLYINLNPLNEQPRRIPRQVFPTFIQSYFFKPSIYLYQSCLGDTAYHFTINNGGPIDSVRWNFGDPSSGKHNTSNLFSPWHSYATGGTYNVQVIAYFQFGSDTLQQSITIPGPPLRNVLGRDTTLCAGSTYKLSPNVPQALSYKWPDNSTDSVFQVTQPGTYWVEITTECGPYRDSVEIDYLSPPVVNLGNDLTLCAGESITLKPNLANAAYLWQDGSTKDSLVIDKPGVYWLQASNRCGNQRDSIMVTYRQPLPANLLGPDTILCEGISYTLQAKGNYTYQWQDGRTGSSFTITQPGTYYADITNSENCTVRDSITVSYRYCFGEEYLIPNIITPNQDGKNDSFVIWGTKAGTLELSIYNRWGTRIYQSSNYKNDWQAEKTSAGIYYYLLRNKETNKTYKGWLEVVK